MNRNKQQYDDDDGRVICSMDVDGMPHRFRRPSDPIQARKDIPGNEQLTKSEAKRFTAYALLAVLLIGTVFSATWILFTLFLTKILFR